MAFCMKCGAAIDQGATFCGRCGTPVQQTPGAASPTPPPPQMPPQMPPQYSYTAGSSGPAPNLVTRVTNILTKPKEEWNVIAGEPATVAGLYSGYIVILAAIPAVAGFLGMFLFSSVALGVFAHLGFAYFLVSAILGYALGLVGVYLGAFVIEKLAPNFQSQGNTIQALKLVAYANTALWVAGVCSIIPIIGLLGVLAGGIYSIYLFYLGLPPLMKTPPDKVVTYMIVSAAVIIVIYVVIYLVLSGILRAVFLGF